MSQTDTGQEYTPGQLREMDQEEAEWMLDDEQMERWRKLRELDEQAADTREEWDEQAEGTVEALVRADMGEFTTEVELFGNSLEVLVNLGEEQRRLITKIEDEYADIDEGSEVTEEKIQDLEGMLAAFYSLMITSWNGTDLDDLSEDEQYQLTEHAVKEWGVRPAIHGMLDILETVGEKDSEAVERIEKFRGPERRGGR